jgi:hypothetical protein
LLDQFKLARLRHYAASSEKNVLQNDLFDKIDQSLPAHFPREMIECDITEAEKICAACGQHKERFGEELASSYNRPWLIIIT